MRAWLLSLFRFPLCCWFGFHDYRPILEPHRIGGVCALCNKQTEGWSLTHKPLRYVRPVDGEWNRLRWYQHLGLTIERFQIHKGHGAMLRRVK